MKIRICLDQPCEILFQVARLRRPRRKPIQILQVSFGGSFTGEFRDSPFKDEPRFKNRADRLVADFGNKIPPARDHLEQPFMVQTVAGLSIRSPPNSIPPHDLRFPEKHTLLDLPPQDGLFESRIRFFRLGKLSATVRSDHISNVYGIYHSRIRS